MKFNIQKQAVKVGGVAAGAIAGELLEKVTFVSELNPYIKGGAKIAIGAIGPELVKGKSKDLVESIGNGMIAHGALDIYKKLTGATVSGVDTSIMAGLGDTTTIIDEDLATVKGTNPDNVNNIMG